MLIEPDAPEFSVALVSAVCPVCSHAVAAPFFAGGRHPLATLGWPASAAEAQSMPSFPQDFVQCPICTHVWNRSFRYDTIPYQKNPNRMFNRGGLWKGHLAATLDGLLERLPAVPTVIDIGCGEGHFVRSMAEVRQGAGRFIGFDPNASEETGRGVEFHARLFDPLVDMATYAPDAVVIRHVLEHFTSPTELLDQLAWGAASLGKPCWLFAEVPCIDRVFETGRLADFFYEHVSHFSTNSFRTLMARSGDIVELAHGYDREVVYALVSLGLPAAVRQRASESLAFARGAEISRTVIQEQITQLADSGAKVAIWGGTGKAAAFIHQFGADAIRFPLVVDSDPEKAGTFVPGTGQEIKFRDVLKSLAVDVVIIPTQWRARDIMAEMAREHISPRQVLIEDGGRLVDFIQGGHPY